MIPVWKLRRYLYRPREELQLAIRLHGGAATWIGDVIEGQPVKNDHDIRSLRAAFLLCLLCGIRPDWAARVETVILDRWQTDATYWTPAELRQAVIDQKSEHAA